MLFYPYTPPFCRLSPPPYYYGEGAGGGGLRVWGGGKGKYACVVSIASEAGVTAIAVREQLAVHDELVHVTVEVMPLTG